MSIESERVKRNSMLFSRVTSEQRDELDLIALYHNKKLSEIIRDEVDNMIKKYAKNPQFLRFKRELLDREKERTAVKKGGK